MPATVAALDIGTTSLKLLLIDGSNGEELQCIRHEISGKINADGERFELRPSILLENLSSLFSLVANGVESVKSFLMCGQMHGIMLWSSSDPFNCTNYVTWQDKRCSEAFLQTLPSTTTEEIVKPKTGFGMATLLWWQRHEPQLFDTYDCCGTICDWMGSILTNCWSPMSTQMAASWGYYDMNNASWDRNTLVNVGGIPSKLLPTIVQPNSVVGKVCESRFINLLPTNCTVYVALGDLQCVVFSVYAQLSREDAFINFGTSAQLGFLCDQTQNWDKIHQDYPSVECFPYFNQNSRIILAASLNGGDVLVNFVQLLCNWMEQLAPVDNGNAFVTSEQYVWQRLEQLANDSAINEANSDGAPVVQARMFGERSVPGQQEQQYGSVHNITSSNCKQLGIVYQALCSGLINNLLSLCPLALLRANGVNAIGLAGTAIDKNTILRAACVQLLSPIRCQLLGNAADAANGLVLQFLNKPFF